MPNFVYILANPANQCTYVGYTNNPKRRLRQHNGELCGGARFTSMQCMRTPGLKWYFACLISSIGDEGDMLFDTSAALSLEWHIKYQTRKNKFKGVMGRMAALGEALKHPRFVELVQYIQIDELPDTSRITQLCTDSLSQIEST